MNLTSPQDRYSNFLRHIKRTGIFVTPPPEENRSAYEYTADLLSRTIPHEAGHAVVAFTLGLKDALEWISIYCVTPDGVGGGGCCWANTPCESWQKWATSAGGMAAEEILYGAYYKRASVVTNKN